MQMEYNNRIPGEAMDINNYGSLLLDRRLAWMTVYTLELFRTTWRNMNVPG